MCLGLLFENASSHPYFNFVSTHKTQCISYTRSTIHTSVQPVHAKHYSCFLLISTQISVHYFSHINKAQFILLTSLHTQHSSYVLPVYTQSTIHTSYQSTHTAQFIRLASLHTQHSSYVLPVYTHSTVHTSCQSTPVYTQSTIHTSCQSTPVYTQSTVHTSCQSTHKALFIDHSSQCTLSTVHSE